MTRTKLRPATLVAVAVGVMGCVSPAFGGIEASARVSNAGHIDGGAFTLTLPRDSGDRGFPITWDFTSGYIGRIDTAFGWEGNPDAGSNQYLDASFSYHNQSDETFNVDFLSRVDTLDIAVGSTLTSEITLRVEDTNGDGVAMLQALSPTREDGMSEFGSFTIGVDELNHFGLPSIVLADSSLSHAADGPIGVDTPLENLVTYTNVEAPIKGAWNTLVLQAGFSVSAGDTVYFDFRLDVSAENVPTPTPGAALLLGGAGMFGASRRRRG